ncbi:MAG: Rad52/Rad22 family DNA repair protein [Thermomicrobiales bacterium]
MGFSVKQRRALNSDLKPSVIRTRQRQGRELSYIEGWHAIAEANRIFGPDGWNRETVETKCLLGRERQGQYEAVYVARVRITVRATDQTVTRDGIGSGEAQGESLGEAHDKAIKTAETDATKRALATFGKPFGLSLYLGKHQPTNPQSKTADLPSPVGRRRTLQQLGANGRFYVEKSPAPVLDPDLERALQQRLAKPDQPSGSLTTAPSHTEEIQVPTVPTGQEDDVVSSSPVAADQSASPASAPGQPRATPLDRMASIAVPSTPREPHSAGAAIAEAPSPMLLPRPARRREPGHLRYVATQPCLLCGRTPSDAHHLKFAQPRAMSKKVSDEFTVPLCRTHHRQLHDSGNEIAWWIDMDIDPLPIAQDLWAESTGAQGHQKAKSTSGKN